MPVKAASFVRENVLRDGQEHEVGDIDSNSRYCGLDWAFGRILLWRLPMITEVKKLCGAFFLAHRRDRRETLPTKGIISGHGKEACGPVTGNPSTEAGPPFYMDGNACTRCGKCCKAMPCGVSGALLGDWRGCAALEPKDDGTYQCGIVRKTSDYIDLGENATWKDDFMRGMFSHLLGIGLGCCSTPEGEEINRRMREAMSKKKRKLNFNDVYSTEELERRQGPEEMDRGIPDEEWEAMTTEIDVQA